MQTFLPYESFYESAKVLDNLRLGKQRVEAHQILQAILHGGGWANHPATLMWRDTPVALAAYGAVICLEWIDRGFQDTLLEKFLEYPIEEPYDEPWWLGLDDFHASHRSNLLRKSPEHYGQFGWAESNDLPYVWPKPLSDDYERGPYDEIQDETPDAEESAMGCAD